MGHLVNTVHGSFRDPAGFVFVRDGVLYRQIHSCDEDNYQHLMTSGLYERLVRESLLVAHEEVSLEFAADQNAVTVIRPEKIPFIAYPYEWCFSQLKDAALTTLKIQRTALQFGMMLKDASAFNIQFHRGKPVLIDTLSFERYVKGMPWAGYRQFCEHFIAPLALSSLRRRLLTPITQIYLDGIPLDLASALLPLSSWLNMGLVSHIHLHAKSQKQFADAKIHPDSVKISSRGLEGLLEHLAATVGGLRWNPATTHWSFYEQTHTYASEAMKEKTKTVEHFLDETGPGMIWDLGANLGTFSRIASRKGHLTIALEQDPVCVEKNYNQCREEGEENLLPFLCDLSRPSPSAGWGHEERFSLAERGPAEGLLALALVHHLAIAGNVPLAKIAQFFSRIARRLLIEFVPKSDSQAERLLKSRKNIFPDYHQKAFEEAMEKYFSIESRTAVPESGRILYAMRCR